MPWNCIPSSDVEEAWSLWKDMFLVTLMLLFLTYVAGDQKTKHWFSINLKIICIIGWLNPQPLMDAQI